jgi:SAM-dependent methyltransferase
MVKKAENKIKGRSAPILVNLCCGNKIYDPKQGWFNYDLTLPKEAVGKEGFVHGDAMDIDKNFEDGVVDEIHFYHGIEHFYLWEAAELIKKMQKVLKPGGKIFFEQPDVVKCAINLLQEVTTGDSKTSYNLGLLGFYGEPVGENKDMNHKWGWSPRTLTNFLLDVGGWSTIEQKPATTHAKDLRDFRLVATKEV